MAVDFVLDFLYVGDGDAIVIWAREPGINDWVFFVDGGDAGNGEKVIAHYDAWIKPHLQATHKIGFVNTHPHADHIDGLLEILEHMGNQISFGIYNDPVECISTEHRDRIKDAYMDGEDPDITHLYTTFEQVDKLNSFCEKHKVARGAAFADDINLLNGSFRLLSPYKDFYVNQVQYFTDVDFLTAEDVAKSFSEVDEEVSADDDLKPCTIVDAVNETSPENLTSVIIQLTDSQGRKYILTADAGVDAFDYMEGEGFDASNIRLVQLPHHGSRGNVSSQWLKKFSPEYFVASAVGNTKHPRRAVINCIKRNIENCGVYSTHSTKACISLSTNASVFPVRNWGPAMPL